MSCEVLSDGPRISVKGHVTPGDLGFLLAALHDRIAVRGYSDITLDYSMCDGVTEAVMLPLMPIVLKYQEDGVDLRLVLPQEELLQRLFRNTNWAHHIDPGRYAPNLREGGNVPALRFGNDETGDADELLDRVMNLIPEQLNTSRDALKAVEWSLGEIMDNVSNHARVHAGGFVQATAYKTGNEVEFVVADAGIGIPRSMNMSGYEDQALRNAISEGIIRDKTGNAGDGLYGSFRVASLSGGQFEIRSKEALLYIDPDRIVVSRTVSIPYEGTSVRCRINLGDRDLLGKALRFKGKPHDPPYDFIERHFETAAGDFVFHMKKEAARKLGTRQGGVRVRSKIQNLLREDASVVIDMEGIGVVSSGFADEVFGRLFVDMGPRNFMARIDFRNVDSTVGGLIDRAILQRTKLGDGSD